MKSAVTHQELQLRAVDYTITVDSINPADPDAELEERCADAVNYCNVLQQQGGCDLTGNSKFKLTGEFVEKVRNKLCQKTCGLC